MAWCIPVISAAASLAGAGMGMAGAQRARDEANRQTSLELDRQRKLQQEAEATYAQARNQATPEAAKATIGQGANQRQQEYEAVQNVPLSYSQPGTQIGKAVVNARDASTLNLGNRVRAALAGYDEFMLKRMLEQQQTGNLLGVTSNLARSSGSVLPLELQAASRAGNDLSGAGGLLSSLGNYGSAYAASSGSLCGKPPVNTPPNSPFPASRPGI